MDLQTIDELVEFELSFYDYVYGTDSYEILMYPDADGAYPDDEEVVELHKRAASENFEIGYQFRKYDGDILIFSKGGDKLGIVHKSFYDPNAMQ